MITTKDLLDSKMCFNPITGMMKDDPSVSAVVSPIPEDWSGTLLDILKYKGFSKRNMVWLVSWFAKPEELKQLIVLFINHLLETKEISLPVEFVEFVDNPVYGAVYKGSDGTNNISRKIIRDVLNVLGSYNGSPEYFENFLAISNTNYPGILKEYQVITVKYLSGKKK